eukprot:scaffold14878_cov114-Skeletonema_marinoi.AAC.2
MNIERYSRLVGGTSTWQCVAVRGMVGKALIVQIPDSGFLRSASYITSLDSSFLLECTMR